MRVEDYLWAETDDACALCGCRERRALTIHHIDGDDQNNVYDNRIILCHNCHQRHHGKHGDVTAEQIRDRKRRLIMRTLTQYGVNAIRIAGRRGHVVGAPFLLDHLVQLGFLRRETELQVFSDEGKEAVEVDCQYVITDDGRRLLSEWL
ncbi:MAG: hypothetical protein DCC65_13165 [Planctomycetota bacterium]|nr:MAG: hypothetical protein DCC65_13165 [Planctomycetota bacterium]